MKQFSDLDEILVGEDEPGLILTIGGRPYTIPPPSAAVGLWCERMIATAGVTRSSTATEVEVAAAMQRVPDLGDDATVPERLLGPAYAEMTAAGVDHIRMRIATMTVMMWIVAGDEVAERFWRAGGRPEQQGPNNRAERRASTSTDAASTTKQPASGSGTSHHPNSSRNGRARRSRGRKSSRSGVS
jgi:hypothetical protein